MNKLGRRYEQKNNDMENKNENKKHNWGGPRPNSGRPRCEKARKTTVFRLEIESLDILKKVHNKNAFVEAAIREKAERDGIL